MKKDEVKEIAKEGKGDKDNGGHNLLTIIFIVNGEATEVKANVNTPLKTAVNKALEESGNTGRPLEDWLVKRGAENLDISKKIEEFQFPDRVELYLSLRAGEGGCNARG